MNIDSHAYYLAVMLLSISFPFLLSFDKKVNFKQYFGTLAKSTLLIAVPFILGDVLYTHLGVWGFNPNFHYPTKVAGLPLEEIAFFFVVPYCCVFIYACLKAYFNLDALRFNAKILLAIAFPLLVIGIFNFDRYYTCATFICSAIILFGLALQPPNFLNNLLVGFVISCIPFTLVNGFLTGMFTPEPIVWYNNNENLAIRFFSIPIEDFSYSFNFISLNILAFEFLISLKIKR